MREAQSLASLVEACVDSSNPRFRGEKMRERAGIIVLGFSELSGSRARSARSLTRQTNDRSQTKARASNYGAGRFPRRGTGFGSLLNFASG